MEPPNKGHTWDPFIERLSYFVYYSVCYSYKGTFRSSFSVERFVLFQSVLCWRFHSCLLAGVSFDVRRLNVGDFTWIAREKSLPTPGDLSVM